MRIEDGLLAMGWPIDRAVLGGARMESRAGELFFDALYWLYAQVAPTRRLGGWLLETLGGRRAAGPDRRRARPTSSSPPTPA